MLDIRSTGLLGALLLGAVLPAQQTEQPADPQAEYKALTQEYGKAQRDYIAEFRKQADEAKKNGQASIAFSFTKLAEEWAPKFLAKAEQFRGTDGAIPFLTWVYGNAPDQGDEVLDKLLEHVKSKEFGTAVTLIGRRAAQLGKDKVGKILAQVIEQNPDGDVKAQAYLARAEALLQPEKGDDGEEKVDEAARKAALADLHQGLECAEDAALRGRLSGVLNEQEHLQVGMVAPEITGEDLDGVTFKLSDYRGKVVLLDFWGYW